MSETQFERENPTVKEPDLPGADRTALWNLTAILLLGVGVLAWFGYHTDLLPAIGGLLGLGGVLAWVGFVANVLTEERSKAFRAYVDRKIVVNTRTWKYMVATGSLALLLASVFGTIEVDALRESVDRAAYVTTVEAFQSGLGKASPDRIRPHGRVRFTRPLGRPYVVKVSGFPARLVRVSRFRRRPLHVPSSFQRHVVLLRPTLALSSVLILDPPTWDVSIQVLDGGGTPVGSGEVKPFDGHSIWLGAQPDVPIPKELAATWADQNAILLGRWLRPRTPVGSMPIELASGQTIVVSISKRDGSVERELGRFEIDPLKNTVIDWIQIEDLELGPTE